MAGELITGDWQLEYNGVLLGDDTPFLVAQITGLLDLPFITSADKMMLRRNGLRAGDDFTGGRSIVLTLEIASTDTVTFSDAVDLLTAATAPTGPPLPLVFQLPGVAGGAKRVVYCRPRKRSLPVGRDFYYELPIATIELFSVDPRIEDNQLNSASTTLPTAGGGLNFNAVAPIVFGAMVEGGTLQLENSGNFATNPTFTLSGPVTNPRIESLTQDSTLSFNISLSADETLVVDTQKRTVMLNGTANRYNTLNTDAQWFDFSPGVNDIRYVAATTTSSTMTVTWRSAWV